MRLLLIIMITATLILSGCAAELEAEGLPPQPIVTIEDQESAPVEKQEPIQEFHTMSYTLEDVAPHAEAEDCWTIINGEVYDVSEYTDQHSPAILEACGRDGTSLFESRPSIGTPHPASAKTKLDNYKIGILS